MSRPRRSLINSAIALGVYLVIQSLIAIRLAVTASTAGSTLADKLYSWDSQWFIRIARFGYSGGPLIDDQPPQFHTIAFFPATAWLIRAGRLFTFSWIDAALLANIVIGCAASLVLIAIVSHYTTNRVAQVLSVALFAGAPLSVTNLMAYSEALFALATFLFILGVIKEKWWLAAVGVFIACLTRMTGFDLAAAYLILIAVKYRTNVTAWISCALAPLGGIVYILWATWQSEAVGGYFEVQKTGWGTQFDWGQSTFSHLPELLFDSHSTVPILSALVIVGVIVAVLAAACVRIPLPLWLPATIIAANIVLSSGYYHSRPRLLLMAVILLGVGFIINYTEKLSWLVSAVTVFFVAWGIWFSAYMLVNWRYAI